MSGRRDDPRGRWARRRCIGLARSALGPTIGVVGLVVLSAGCSGHHAVDAGTTTGPAVPPPTVVGPVEGAEAEAEVAVPEGVLVGDELSRRPLNQDGVFWVHDVGADLPTLLSPCGRPLRSDADRVGGRQHVLIGPRLWKSERLVVYGDVDAAIGAFAEITSDLSACSRHDDARGTTVWSMEALSIGDEAMFVGGQLYRGDKAVPGNHRGVLLREGRVVVTYLDFGPRAEPSKLADVDSYQRHGEAVASRLSRASWAGSP